jgi:hypothetical protein
MSLIHCWLLAGDDTGPSVQIFSPSGSAPSNKKGADQSIAETKGTPPVEEVHLCDSSPLRNAGPVARTDYDGFLCCFKLSASMSSMFISLGSLMSC